MKIPSFGAGVRLACALLSVGLLSAGCGGAGDGSKPATLKVNDPRVSGNLTFTDVTPGAIVDVTPLIGINSVQPAILTNARAGNGAINQTLVTSVVADRDPVVTRLSLSLSSSVTGGTVAPFRGGQRLEFPRAGSNIEFAQSNATLSTATWRATSGAVVVRSIGAGRAQIQFDGVRFEPVAGNARAGSFTLNGTLSATALTVRG